MGSQRLNLIEQAERTDGAAFHFVIRTRPDLFWFGDFPLSASALRPNTTYMRNHTFGPWQHLTVDWNIVLDRRDACGPGGEARHCGIE